MMSLVPSIFGEMDDVFDDMFNFNGFGYNNRMMSTDVKEAENHYQIEIELPGYNKEDIHADLKDGYLTISAEHKDENDKLDHKGNYIRRERRYGNCSRNFFVGKEITEEDIKATFKNGILSLIVPKKNPNDEVEQKSCIAIEG